MTAMDDSAIEFGLDYTTIKTFWITDMDDINCVAFPIGQFIVGPFLWYTRIDLKTITRTLQAQNRFDAQAIHPACRTRIPCPAAALNMRCNAIDVGGDDVGFDLVYSY